MLPGPQPTSRSRMPGRRCGRRNAAASSAVRCACCRKVAGAWPWVYFSWRTGSGGMGRLSCGSDLERDLDGARVRVCGEGVVDPVQAEPVGDERRRPDRAAVDEAQRFGELVLID